MTKGLFFLLFSLILFEMHGSHLVGGEMSFECLGGNQYRINMDLYRDADRANVPAGQLPTDFDPEAYFIIYNAGNNAVHERLNIPINRESRVVENDLDVCLTNPPQVEIYQGQYEFVVNLPPNGSGYNIVHARCCRAPGILNLRSSDEQGSTYVLFISNESLLNCNNGPKLKSSPPILLCSNVVEDYDHSADDIENDRIEYSLCTPFRGGTQDCPFFGDRTNEPGFEFCLYDPGPPPYSPVTYNSPYTADRPLGERDNGQLRLELNSSTGRMLITPKQLGKFVVGVCMEEYRGGKLMSRSFRDFQFNVNDCGVAQASLDNTDGFQCTSLTVNFDPDASTGAESYYWNFGDGDTSILKSPIHTYADVGSYDVQLIINKGLPCESEVTKIFNVYPEFVVDFDFDSDCTEQKITFSNKTFSSLDDWNSTKWYFDNSATPITEIDPVLNLTGQTNVDVKLVATTENGCRDSITKNIIVEQQPIADFSITNSCANQLLNIENLSQATSESLDRFRWVIEGAEYNDFEPAIQFGQSGTKAFRLVTYSSTGCKDSIEQLIDILDSVSLKIIKPDLICSNIRSEFSAVSDGQIIAYDWSFGNGEKSSLEIGDVIFRDPGTYTVELLATTIECGEKLRSTQVFVQSTPDFDLQRSLDVCEGSSEELEVRSLSVPDADIAWSTGDQGSSTTVFSTDNEIKATVSKDGCARTRITLVTDKCDIYVPNAFAPNGRNSGFMIIGKNVASFELLIYNRWGELIFESTSFSNPWDGTYRGSPAPLDTYVYFVKGVKVDGDTFEKRGAVALIR